VVNQHYVGEVGTNSICLIMGCYHVFNSTKYCVDHLRFH